MPTLTLLAACNEALLNVGENEVTDLASPVGKKARLAVQNAIRTISTMHNWLHLQAVVSANSWVNGYAVLPAIEEVYNVTLRNDVLESASADMLYNYAVRNPMTGSTPMWYARAGENRVLVYPEPSVTDKPLVQFRVMLQQSVPQLGSDSFTLPDDVYDLVAVYAQMLLHRNHTTDSVAMQACASEYEMRLHMIRSRDASQVVGSMG